VRPVHRFVAEEEGTRIEADDPTGRLIEPIDAAGNKLPARPLMPDPGFATNPAKQPWNPDLGKYPDKLVKQYEQGLHEATKLMSNEALSESVVRGKQIRDVVGDKAFGAASANASKVLSEAKVFVNVSDDVLENILNEGFKTQFETGTSNGILDFSGNRVALEKRLFGEGKHPIYGYFSDLDSYVGSSHYAQHYGATKIRLRKGINNFATITGADSLETQVIPSALNKEFQLSSLFNGDLTDRGERWIKNVTEDIAKAQNTAELYEATNGAYLEAQIHKKILLSDIQSIYTDIPHGEISAATHKLLKENGIKLRTIYDLVY